MAESPRKPPDWSHLPSDILHVIASSHLPNLPDVVRLRCVCRRWRSSVVPTDLDPDVIIRPPWLLLPYQPSSPSLPFLNPTDLRIYSLPLLLGPTTAISTVFGSTHGFLILITNPNPNPNFEISLYNPFSQTLIPFPPLSLPLKPVRKAILRKHPAILVTILLDKTLAFCSLGSESWTVLDVGGSSYGGQELACRGNRLYVASCTRLIIFDLDSPCCYKILDYEYPFQRQGYLSVHLVDDPGAGVDSDILLLGACRDGERFDVYRMGLEGDLSVEEEVGDRLFFVSRRQTMCVAAEGVDSVEGMEGKCGLTVNEMFMEYLPSAVYFLRSKEDGGLVRDEFFWRTPYFSWADWRDTMKITWFLPKLC